jgi:plasmid stabilization system protein ParE
VAARFPRDRSPPKCQACIESLPLYAGVHARYLGNCRALFRLFPCAIYYRVNGDVIEVWRVLDGRSNPKRVAKALAD